MKLTKKSIENEINDLDLKEALLTIKMYESKTNLNIDNLYEKYNKKYLKKIKEEKRVHKLYEYERYEYKKGYKYIGGIDEAGRGPLAGPVVAACVVLPFEFFIEGINDSKKLSESKREELFEVIQKRAVDIGIGIIENNLIDDINILNATHLAMKKAVSIMKTKPDCLLVDALRIKDIKIYQKPIIKGDSLSASIAAASIIAKVTRDRIIKKYHSRFPEYNLKSNKGYGTKEHIEAIKKYGITDIHRKTFVKNFI